MPRPLRWALAAALFSVPILAGLYVPLASGPSLCTFRNLTGFDCPGCGLTRSVVALLHGQVRESLRAHPLGALVFTTFLLLWGSALGSWAKRGRFVSPIGAKTPTWIFAAFVVVYLAVYALRLAGALGGTADPPGPGLLTTFWR